MKKKTRPQARRTLRRVFENQTNAPPENSLGANNLIAQDVPITRPCNRYTDEPKYRLQLFVAPIAQQDHTIVRYTLAYTSLVIFALTGIKSTEYEVI